MTAPISADDLSTASDVFAELADRVLPDQAERPTPCPAWDVRAVVNHVVGGQLAFTGIVSGGPRIDRDADFLGTDPVGAVRSSSAGLVAALAAPGVLGQLYATPIGEAPGAAIASLRTVEMLVHGWDLASATGEDLVAPDELVTKAIAVSRAMLGGVPRTGHPFGPEQSAGSDATPLDQLAALLGRPVPWPGTDAPG